MKTAGPHLLTLIPPSMIGPPEFVHIDIKDTDIPAIVSKQLGKGRSCGSPGTSAASTIDTAFRPTQAYFEMCSTRLQPQRQLRTNAHPLVETTLMRQGGRTLLHLVNLSGHSQTGYFAPVPMNSIRVEVAGTFKSAKTVRAPGSVAVRASQGYTELTHPTTFRLRVDWSSSDKPTEVTL